MRTDITKLAKEHGLDKLLFRVPIQMFIHDSKLDLSLDCVVDERRYKAADGYKIGLRTVNRVFVSGLFSVGVDHLYFDTYTSDIESMMDSDRWNDFSVSIKLTEEQIEAIRAKCAALDIELDYMFSPLFASDTRKLTEDERQSIVKLMEVMAEAGVEA